VTGRPRERHGQRSWRRAGNVPQAFQRRHHDPRLAPMIKDVRRLKESAHGGAKSESVGSTVRPRAASNAPAMRKVGRRVGTDVEPISDSMTRFQHFHWHRTYRTHTSRGSVDAGTPAAHSPMTAPWAPTVPLVVDSVTGFLSGQYSSGVVLGLMREFRLGNDRRRSRTTWPLCRRTRRTPDLQIPSARASRLEAWCRPSASAALGYFRRDEDRPGWLHRSRRPDHPHRGRVRG
jgi:hypothetical protein